MKDKYRISDNKCEIQLEKVKALLSDTYWAKERSVDTIELSIENSVCFSVFHGEVQVGFARVVTDYATVAYIADVIIHKQHQRKGLGKWLVKAIVNDERWSDKFQLLATNDAHSLYEKYGFSGSNKLMSTPV